MLALIAVILLVLWAVGLFAHVFGAAIHVLLVLAIILAIVHFVRGSSTRSAP